MSYKITEVEAFLAVMELGTVTEAAARLGLSKSVVSSRLTGLEGALETKLFLRQDNRLLPTREAERLEARVRPALTKLLATLQSAARKKISVPRLNGLLRISAPISLASISIDELSAGFAEIHPDLELSIDYNERYRNSFPADFDVGILTGEVLDATLIRRKIWDDRMVACASPSYLETRSVPYHPLELSEHTCIGYSHMGNAQFWRFTQKGRTLSPVTQTRLTANNSVSMCNFARVGLGIAMLPGFIAHPAIASGKLVPLLTKPKTMPKSGQLANTIWRSRRPARGGPGDPSSD
ncbi:LysR substrate-binding domain-containing protein [Sulfitobacter sp. 1A13191]|uniref:LysR family transcriptional regulator n=1 Tax=Sulfitobacter sp. 1A13191 TaxID=3368589 RepID=UPI003746CF7C